MNLFDLLGGDPSNYMIQPRNDLAPPTLGHLINSALSVGSGDPSSMLPPINSTMQAPQLPPTPAAPTPNPGFLERLQNGLFHIPSGLSSLISPEDAKALRSHALLQTGLGILQAAGPHLVRPTLMGSLASGVQAGQQGFGQGVQQDAQAGLVGQQLAQQQKMQALHQQIAQQFPVQPNEQPEQTIARLNRMAEAYANGGDLDTASKLGALANQHAQALQRLSEVNGPANPVRGVEVKTVGPDGKPMSQLVDPTTGNPIGKPMPAYVEPRAGGELTPAQSDRLFFTGINQFQTHSAKAYDALAGAERNLSTLEDHLKTGQLSKQDFMTLTETVQRIVNPGAIVRTQTMAMQKAQTQSIADRINNLMARAGSGTMDPTYAANIVGAARQMLNLQKQAFYAGRQHFAQTYTKRGVPMQASDLYDPFDSGAATPTPGGNMQSGISPDERAKLRTGFTDATGKRWAPMTDTEINQRYGAP